MSICEIHDRCRQSLTSPTHVERPVSLVAQEILDVLKSGQRELYVIHAPRTRDSLGRQ